MIGRWLAELSDSRLRRTFYAVLGVPDFHTHLRLGWIERYRLSEPARLCEMGSGAGFALIEILRRYPRASALALEADAAAIEAGGAYARRLGLAERLAFARCDLDTTTASVDLASFDYVLLLDVLEHLACPSEFAAELVRRIRPGARLLVSVPTPLYPRLFGRAYHVSIGHLHEGFTLAELDRLFEGLTRTCSCYSTGPLSWPGVLLSYRLLTPTARAKPGVARRLVHAASTFAALPFRYLDLWNGPRSSCSLFVEYEKRAADDVRASTGRGGEARGVA